MRRGRRWPRTALPATPAWDIRHGAGGQRLLDERQLVRLQRLLPASRPHRLDAEIIVVAACHDRKFGRTNAPESRKPPDRSIASKRRLWRAAGGAHIARANEKVKAHQSLERSLRKSTPSEKLLRLVFRNGKQRADNILWAEPERIENPLYLALLIGPSTSRATSLFSSS